MSIFHTFLPFHGINVVSCGRIRNVSSERQLVEQLELETNIQCEHLQFRGAKDAESKTGARCVLCRCLGVFGLYDLRNEARSQPLSLRHVRAEILARGQSHKQFRVGEANVINEPVCPETTLQGVNVLGTGQCCSLLVLSALNYLISNQINNQTKKRLLKLSKWKRNKTKQNKTW